MTKRRIEWILVTLKKMLQLVVTLMARFFTQLWQNCPSYGPPRQISMTHKKLLLIVIIEFQQIEGVMIEPNTLRKNCTSSISTEVLPHRNQTSTNKTKPPHSLTVCNIKTVAGKLFQGATSLGTRSFSLMGVLGYRGVRRTVVTQPSTLVVVVVYLCRGVFVVWYETIAYCSS